MRTATVTAIEGTRVRVSFPEDDTPSTRLYSTLKSYVPATGDTVIMLETNTGYVCIGAVHKE